MNKEDILEFGFKEDKQLRAKKEIIIKLLCRARN